MPHRYKLEELQKIARHLGWEFSHYSGDHAVFK